MQALIHRPERSRRVSWRMWAVGLTLLASPISLAGGCTTTAVAIEECREIESARCEASVPCGVIEKDEVGECQRFYEDHCLHGISGPEAPTADQQSRCVDRIEEAGTSAREAQIKEAAAQLAIDNAESDEAREAAEMALNQAIADRLKACLVISLPWQTDECSFIGPEEDEGMGGESSEDE